MASQNFQPNESEFDQILALARISALVALREEPELKAELQSSLRKNVSPLLIREAILQTYLFAGYAATINAFHLLNELTGDPSEFLQEAEGSLDFWKQRGKDLCRQIYGDNFEKLGRNMKQLHPDLADWMILEGYGKVLGRPFLSPRIRELLIVAMTVVLQVERQFHSHARGALRVGATGAEIRRILEEVRAKPNYHAILETLIS